MGRSRQGLVILGWLESEIVKEFSQMVLGTDLVRERWWLLLSLTSFGVMMFYFNLVVSLPSSQADSSSKRENEVNQSFFQRCGALL